MILMRIAMPMRENQVRSNLLLEALKYLFHGTAAVREKTIAKVFEDNLFLAAGRKQLGTFSGFSSTNAASAKNDPVKYQVIVDSPELQQSAAAANFNIIRMCTQAEDM